MLWRHVTRLELYLDTNVTLDFGQATSILSELRVRSDRAVNTRELTWKEIQVRLDRRWSKLLDV